MISRVVSGSCLLVVMMALQGCNRGGPSSPPARTGESAGHMPEGAVAPTPQTISSLEYPLARPLFLYVSKKSLARPEVAAFLQFYLSDQGQELVQESMYTPLSAEELQQSRDVLTAAIAEAGSGGSEPGGELVGSFTIDGSSTVFPISRAVAEEFSKLHPKVRISVVSVGTGTGFKRFAGGEIEIADASRAIKEGELTSARENGIEPLELKIGIDGLTVAVNPRNDWVAGLTFAQLKAIWEPGSPIRKWSDVNPDFPDVEITLCGPGPESGTFDYFTEVVIGEAKKCREDYTPSGDDNVLVNIVADDEYALGYFGYAYFAENRDNIKALAIAR